jgi:3',5'-cyclic AMP phosphodiesterase CpdA
MSNLFVVLTDTHFIPLGGSSTLGNMYDWEMTALAHHINSLGVTGVINAGDLKDNYGAPADGHVGLYKTHFEDIIKAPKFRLMGNHDEQNDYSVPGRITTPYTDVFGPPVGFSTIWTEPNVKFIGLDTFIVHDPDIYEGYFEIEESQRTFLTNELASLTTGQKAIIVTHPTIKVYGNQIHATKGGTELIAILEANSSDILCAMCGHVHIIPQVTLDTGINYMAMGAASYVASPPTDARGGFMLLEYTGTSIVFHYMRATAPFGVYDPTLYTPWEVTL